MSATSPAPVSPAPAGEDRGEHPPRAHGHATVVLAVLGVVTAGVIGLGWLLWPNPPASVTWHTGTERHLVTVTVDSPRRGMTDVAVDLTDRRGAPVPGAQVVIEPVMPLMGHGDPAVSAVPSPGGVQHHAEGVHLMTTGPWHLVVVVDPGAATATEAITVPIDVAG